MSNGDQHVNIDILQVTIYIYIYIYIDLRVTSTDAEFGSTVLYTVYRGDNLDLRRETSNAKYCLQVDSIAQEL